MTTCPQCGTSNSDEAKNCTLCRINLYWAAHHHAELARLRQDRGLVSRPDTAAFLLASSKRVDQGSSVHGLRRAKVR